MQIEEMKKMFEMMKPYFKAHPWHGLEVYADDEYLNAYIEILPSDNLKYEMEKHSGYLMIDRPQKFSNIIPALYGFVPKTYCAEESAKYSNAALKRDDLVGDGDALDICVLTERQIDHADLLVNCRIIGGYRMIDHGEVDDKIIAVLKDDAVYGDMKDVSECPATVLNRLKHYFLTYKQIPGEGTPKIEITDLYGADEAKKVLAASIEDYNNHYSMEKMLKL